MTQASDTHRAVLPSAWIGVMDVALHMLRRGELLVVMPDGRTRQFTGGAQGPHASIVIHDGSVTRRLLTGGSIALAETYMDGAWDTPDLDAVLDLGLSNILAGWTSKIPPVLRPVQRAWNSMRDNDPDGGARRNIAYHYDLGNDFYRLWLDDTMTYSAACCENGAELLSADQLEQAQRRKWDCMLDLVQPSSGDHLLEIGCGWGGFAMYAAREAGCHVTGLTLSEEQAAFARDRVRAAGLEDRIEILLQDYRNVPGAYDGIVSIEMFEAVGEKWWPVFFDRVAALLKPRRAAAMQVITIDEDRFESYRRRPDFIQRYVFPGGMLPGPRRFAAAAQKSGLATDAPRFFGQDYVRTLSIWRQRFEQAVPQVRELGFDERFIRMWRYYLAYCKAGFAHDNVDVMQVRLTG